LKIPRITFVAKIFFERFPTLQNEFAKSGGSNFSDSFHGGLIYEATFQPA